MRLEMTRRYREFISTDLKCIRVPCDIVISKLEHIRIRDVKEALCFHDPGAFRAMKKNRD